MAVVLRTEFVCIAYWGGKEIVILTDESGNILTDNDGNILTAEQFVTGLHAATQDWLTDRRFYEGNFSTGNANAWSEGIVVESPAISYGGNTAATIRQNSTSLIIADPDIAISTSEIINLSVMIEHVARDHLDTGTTTDRIRRRAYTCVGWSRSKGTLTLNLEDLTDESLEQTYPALRYKKDATYMPDLLAEDVSTVVPYVAGIGTKVKCTLIKNRTLLSEQVFDGGFSTGTTTHWQVSGTNFWTISDGKAVKTAGDRCALRYPVATTKGKYYVIKFQYSCTAGDAVLFLTNKKAPERLAVTTGEVTDSAVIKVSSATGLPDVGLCFHALEGFAGTIDNVEVYRLSRTDTSNYVLDGDFSTDGGNWIKGTGWSIDTTSGVAIKLSGTTETLSQPLIAAGAYVWSVHFTCTMLSSSGGFQIQVDGTTYHKTISASGTYRLNVIGAAGGNLVLTPDIDCAVSLDWIWVGAWDTDSSNLISDGDFSAQGLWTLGSDSPWDVTEELGKCVKAAGSGHVLSPKPAGVLLQPIAGKYYQVGIDYTRESGFLTLSFGGQTYRGDKAVYGSHLQAESDSVTWYVKATTTDTLKITPTVLFQGQVDNVSVKEVTPYIYSICEKSGAVSFSVNSVYKGTGLSGVIVPTANYAVSTYDAGEFDLHVLHFYEEQVDFSGNRSAIFADVTRIGANQNAITEIARLLVWAGLSVNTTSQTAAEAIATANNMVIDWAYGGDGQGKTIRSYLDQLLLIIRGFTYTNESNEWCFWQDVAQASSATYDESLGDLIEVQAYGQGRHLSIINLSYRPNPLSPDTPLHQLTRTIDALTGEESYEVPMVYNFSAADDLHGYLTNRKQYNSWARVTLSGEAAELGTVLTLTGISPTKWIVVGQNYNYDVDQLELLEYAGAVYTWSEGDEPLDGEGYLPDYSATPPEAPTDVLITLNVVDIATNTAKISVSCTPPTVNFSSVWFETERVSDNTLKLVSGNSSGDVYVATIDGLIQNEEYVLYAYCMNQFGITGIYTDGLEFTAAGDSTITLPIVAGLNLLNDDTPATNPISGDYQNLLLAWTNPLNTFVAGYDIEYRYDTDNFSLLVRIGSVWTTSYGWWINAETEKTKDLYLRIRAFDATLSNFGPYGYLNDDNTAPYDYYTIPDPTP